MDPTLEFADLPWLSYLLSDPFLFETQAFTYYWIVNYHMNYFVLKEFEELALGAFYSWHYREDLDCSALEEDSCCLLEAKSGLAPFYSSMASFEYDAVFILPFVLAILKTLKNHYLQDYFWFHKQKVHVISFWSSYPFNFSVHQSIFAFLFLHGVVSFTSNCW